MADVVDYKIHGNDMQLVEIELDPGEGVRAEAGAMTFMENGIEMQTSASGGLFGGFKRMVTGESFFITTFLNNGSSINHVGFAAPYPGKIIPIDLKDYRGKFICQKDSYLCSANGIEIGIELTKKIGTGFFGGEGFILQKLTGDGMAFVHAGGTIIKKELGPNDEIKVDTGCIVGFEDSVSYDIKFIGGFKNALFGKEGLFLATLRGPGVAYIQSLPISKLSERIVASAGTNKGGKSVSVGGILGGLLDD
ncbi:TIGR00266 family protein [Clostridiaceae bacterium HSG29]|nr:TIGR00266 family protein [Clostridiaceae bacterium HSG29]